MYEEVTLLSGVGIYLKISYVGHDRGRVQTEKNKNIRALARQSIVLIHEGCVFDPCSGQESANECIDKWNDKSISISFSLSLGSINKKIFF